MAMTMAWGENRWRRRAWGSSRESETTKEVQPLSPVWGLWRGATMDSSKARPSGHRGRHQRAAPEAMDGDGNKVGSEKVSDDMHGAVVVAERV